ncbi:MAG TPA: hypothetical protein VLK53_12315 [Gaiellaceae bacterium]|nr:hypothetical protein [Gaiellaceae bacterium]
MRLAGVGVVAKRPKPNPARRPLVPAPRGRRAPVVHYRYVPGTVIHR